MNKEVYLLVNRRVVGGTKRFGTCCWRRVIDLGVVAVTRYVFPASSASETTGLKKPPDKMQKTLKAPLSPDRRSRKAR